MKHSIKELGITLEELYKGEKQINIHLSNKPFIFHVVMAGRPRYNSKENKFIPTTDCKISSFGANLWARTTKGMEMEKYKSIGGLQRALNILVNSKVETDNSLIQYSLSEEVHTF